MVKKNSCISTLPSNVFLYPSQVDDVCARLENRKYYDKRCEIKEST